MSYNKQLPMEKKPFPEAKKPIGNYPESPNSTFTGLPRPLRSELKTVRQSRVARGSSKTPQRSTHSSLGRRLLKKIKAPQKPLVILDEANERKGVLMKLGNKLRKQHRHRMVAELPNKNDPDPGMTALGLYKGCQSGLSKPAGAAAGLGVTPSEPAV